MLDVVKSIWIWGVILLLVILQFLTSLFCRLFDRDPARYWTGRNARRFGFFATKINPNWKVSIAFDERIADPRHPYVFVSNHQSLADIPILCCLPWEMKWVAKQELFRIPFLGWTMRLAGDIPVDRKNRKSRASVFPRALQMLERHCSVMIFPEGTRSMDGKVAHFNQGAFDIAIQAQLPIVPIAIEGSSDCIPKHSWRFREKQHVRVQVLAPIDTKGMAPDDAPALCKRVREMICERVAKLRGVAVAEVDALGMEAGKA